MNRKMTPGLKNLDVLDLTKWLCSLMVVAIHCTPLKPYSFLADVYTAQGICRIAVPLFFAIAGYLLFRKMQMPWSDKRNRTIIIRYCKRIVRLYLVWTVIYFIFPVAYRCGRVDIQLIVQQLKRTVLEASYYHLWYLLATVYAIPLVPLLLKAPKWSIVGYFCTAWALQCLRTTYSWLGVFDLAPLQWVTTNCEVFWNTLCCAVPCILIGVQSSQAHGRRSSKSWLIRTGVAIVISFFELSAAYMLSPDKVHFEYLISMPILIYNLLNWLLSLKFSFRDRRIPQILRLSSTWIYCVHVLVIEGYMCFHASEGIRRFAWVLGVCLLSAGLYAFIMIRRDRKNAHNSLHAGV